MSHRSDMEALIEEYEQKGWKATHGGKHWRLRHMASGTLVFVSSTPSCSRAVANTRSLLKRKHSQALRAISDQSSLIGAEHV